VESKDLYTTQHVEAFNLRGADTLSAAFDFDFDLDFDLDFLGLTRARGCPILARSVRKSLP